MKIRHRYGRLESRTFELSRADVERIVREYISAQHLSVPIPLGSEQTARTPFYWVEEWGDEDGEPFLSVRQEFACDMQEAAPASDAVDPQATNQRSPTTRDNSSHDRVRGEQP